MKEMATEENLINLTDSLDRMILHTFQVGGEDCDLLSVQLARDLQLI